MTTRKQRIQAGSELQVNNERQKRFQSIAEALAEGMRVGKAQRAHARAANKKARTAAELYRDDLATFLGYVPDDEELLQYYELEQILIAAQAAHNEAQQDEQQEELDFSDPFMFKGTGY